MVAAGRLRLERYYLLERQYVLPQRESDKKIQFSSPFLRSTVVSTYRSFRSSLHNGFDRGRNNRGRNRLSPASTLVEAPLDYGRYDVEFTWLFVTFGGRTKAFDE